MGFLDALEGAMDSIETPTPLDLINGVRSAWTDVPNLVNDVVHGDIHSALNYGRNVLGDGKDIVQGLSSLGVSMGQLPDFLSSNKVVSLAESKVLSAAQLAIEGMKKTTGSGDPCTGDEFRGSSSRLQDVVDTLISAEPHTDRWDGTGSQVYNATNGSHRRLASDVQTADVEIAGIIDTEAGQVSRTRQTLDDTSQQLKDYDLATCWMNATPPARALKFGLDCAAAATAMTVVNPTMGILVKNSIENALRIRAHVHLYERAANDTSGNPMGGCDVFAVPTAPLPREDQATPLPDPRDGTVLPSRSQPNTPYTVPSPDVPPVQTPATPFGAPAPARP
jgi:hypothetical protein